MRTEFVFTSKLWNERSKALECYASGRYWVFAKYQNRRAKDLFLKLNDCLFSNGFEFTKVLRFPNSAGL